MAGSMVTMLVKQLADADTVMYTRLITERAAPMIDEQSQHVLALK